MTYEYVPKIWLSVTPDTDCQQCGLRYFQKCLTCDVLVCTWCAWIESDKVYCSKHIPPQ